MKHAMSPSSVRPSTSKRCVGTAAAAYGVGHSTSATWCSTSSRATRTATNSLCLGRDSTSSWKYSNQAPTSCKQLTVKFSPMLGTSNSYVAFTINPSKLLTHPRLSKVLLLSRENLFSFFHFPHSLVMPDCSHSRGRASLGGCKEYTYSGKNFLRPTPLLR